MPSRILTSSIVAVAFALLAACGGSANKTSPASPSETPTIDSFVGGWTSAATTPTQGSPTCTRLNYEIRKTSDASATVTYDAKCGGYDVIGTGAGTLTGSTLRWNAAGTVAGNGLNCPFEFKDNTATPQGTDAILVTYNVTVCGIGPISGTQLLHRKP